MMGVFDITAFRKAFLLLIIIGGLTAGYFAVIFPSLVVAILILFFVLLIGILIAVKFPEVAFAFFLVAGFYKAEISILLPHFIDLTVLFGVLAASGIVIRIHRNWYRIPRIPDKFLLPYVGLVLVMFASLLYTSAPNYGIDKFLRFSTITTFAAFGPIFLFANPSQLNRFFYTLIAISVAGVLDAYIGSAGRFHTAFGSSYIALGRMAGMGSLLAIYYLWVTRGLTNRLFWITILVINSFDLLYAGARGPAIALFVSIGVIFLASVKLRLKKPAIEVLQSFIVPILVVGLAVFVYPSAFSTFIGRMKLLLPGGGLGASAMKRLYLQDRAISAMFDAPLLGQGVGGFSKYALGIDARAYPHDIFLEIGSELGVVGLALFLALIMFCFAQILRIRRKSEGLNDYYTATVLAALFVFTLVAAMVSGDINDNRIFFAWIGVIYGFATWVQKGYHAERSLHAYKRPSAL